MISNSGTIKPSRGPATYQGHGCKMYSFITSDHYMPDTFYWTGCLKILYAKFSEFYSGRRDQGHITHLDINYFNVRASQFYMTFIRKFSHQSRDHFARGVQFPGYFGI